MVPATGTMLYEKVPPLHRLEADPVMVHGVAGTELTVTDLAVLVPQAFPAVTEITPLA